MPGYQASAAYVITGITQEATNREERMGHNLRWFDRNVVGDSLSLPYFLSHVRLEETLCSWTENFLSNQTPSC